MRRGGEGSQVGLLTGPNGEKEEKGWAEGVGPKLGFAGPRGMKGKGVGWAGLGLAESSELGLFWTGLQGFG